MQSTAPKSFSFRSWKFLAFLLAAFGFRFLFGLYCPPIIVGEDEVQIYTIGLKSFTTHTWPTFGPDVVSPDTAFTTQIPGALQGLLVALPLKVLPIPESPILFLNLLSLLAFSFLGWYLYRRLPSFSPYFIFTWLFIAPWSLHYTTQVLNPSYAAIGAILFFIGFLESLQFLGPHRVPVPLSNLLMGFGLFWVFQLHMSWVLLGPFMAVSLFIQWRKGRLIQPVLFAFLGALPMLALLIPTYICYGFTTGKDVHGFMSSLNWSHVRALPNVMGKFLSFASFEMPRFIGSSFAERSNYLFRNWELLLPGTFLWIVGLLQPVAMIYLAVVKKDTRNGWDVIRWTTLGCVLMVWASFWFAVKSVGSNAIYITFPVAFIFSFYCWNFLANSSRWRLFAKIFLVLGIIFQAGYAYVAYRNNDSVYLQTKSRMKQAIQQNDYRILAERRPHTFY
jgi:hypothetical protein